MDHSGGGIAPAPGWGRGKADRNAKSEELQSGHLESPANGL